MSVDTPHIENEESVLFSELLEEKRHKELLDAILQKNSLNEELKKFISINSEILLQILNHFEESKKQSIAEVVCQPSKIESNNDAIINSFENLCNELMSGLTSLSNKVERNKVLSVEYIMEKDSFSGSVTKITAIPKYKE